MFLVMVMVEYAMSHYNLMLYVLRTCSAIHNVGFCHVRCVMTPLIQNHMETLYAQQSASKIFLTVSASEPEEATC